MGGTKVMTAGLATAVVALGVALARSRRQFHQAEALQHPNAVELFELIRRFEIGVPITAANVLIEGDIDPATLTMILPQAIPAGWQLAIHQLPSSPSGDDVRQAEMLTRTSRQKRQLLIVIDSMAVMRDSMAEFALAVRYRPGAGFSVILPHL